MTEIRCVCPLSGGFVPSLWLSRGAGRGGGAAGGQVSGYLLQVVQADPHGYGSLVASDVLCDDAGLLGVGDRRQVGSVSIGLTLKLRSEEPR